MSASDFFSSTIRTKVQNNVRINVLVNYDLAAETREDIRALLQNLRDQAQGQVTNFDEAVTDLRATRSIHELERSETVILLRPHRAKDFADVESAA